MSVNTNNSEAVRAVVSPGGWRQRPEDDEESVAFFALYLRVMGYARKYLFSHVILAVAAMLALSAATSALPLLIKRLIDSLSALKVGHVTPADLHGIHIVALEILALFIIRAITDFTSSYLTGSLGLGVAADLRAECNDRLQYLPLSFFDDASTGKLLQIFLMESNAVSSVVTNTLTSLAGDATTLVGLAAGLFIMNWRLALIALAVFPLAILPVITVAKRVRKIARKGRRELANILQVMMEAVQGCRVVKSFGAEEYETRRFRAHLDYFRDMFKHIILTSASVNPVIEALAAFAVIAVLWLGLGSVASGIASPGTFAGFITSMLLIYRPFKHLAGMTNSHQVGLAATARLFRIIDEPPEIYDLPDTTELNSGPHTIELKHVSFRYSPTAEWALSNVSLKIEAGKVVALVGMSGGGKSTLSQLIPRFYDPEEGVVLIDGVDVKHYSLRSLRAQIGIVSQHTFLFNDTIRANVAYGSHSRSFEEIVAAAKLANAHDFIMRLPKGYETEVGEFGVRLSGGERQRLAIARALLKNAPILILDEPSSSLDAQAERTVQEAIEPLMKNRTTLLIAHRLATVRRADRIFVLAKGEVVEEGTHEELLAKRGAYRRLYELQYYLGDSFDQAVPS